ncbi:hypothetical protein T02_8086 [Trichinella nativa]|uniref:Uncharacterized protein n=1 Tax=Trichinella nativa TaxID=6335 RepID=A0A0V1L5G4_9BILA|nr:hypothetical protein T02_8086 [Trichinella nativa]
MYLPVQQLLWSTVLSDLPENYGDHLPSAARCGIVDVAGQSMQGCIRNSGSFSACTQPAESSGAGVVRNKSRILAAGLLLCVPISSTSFPSVNSKVIEDSSDPEGTYPDLPGCINNVVGLNVFASATLAISAKSERLTMRLEDAHGRMDPFSVMELSDDATTHHEQNQYRDLYLEFYYFVEARRNCWARFDASFCCHNGSIN